MANKKVENMKDEAKKAVSDIGNKMSNAKADAEKKTADALKKK